MLIAARYLNPIYIKEDDTKLLTKKLKRKPTVLEQVYYSIYNRVKTWENTTQDEKNLVFLELHYLHPYIPLYQVETVQTKSKLIKKTTVIKDGVKTEQIAEEVDINKYQHLPVRDRIKCTYIEQWHLERNKLIPDKLQNVLNNYTLTNK